MLKTGLILLTLAFGTSAFARTTLLTCQTLKDKNVATLKVNLEDDMSVDYLWLEFAEQINDEMVASDYFVQTNKGTIVPTLQSGGLTTEIYPDNFKFSEGVLVNGSILMVQAIANDPNSMYNAQFFTNGSTYNFICKKDNF